MAPLAAAYSGPPKLTIGRAFTEWRMDAPMLVLIALIAAWYLISVRRVRRSGGQWGTGRSFAFIALGLGFWTIATMAWPGVYESVLFYARATQTVLLVLVAPLFLAMGKPLTLLIEASPLADSPRSPRATTCCPSSRSAWSSVTSSPIRRYASPSSWTPRVPIRSR